MPFSANDVFGTLHINRYNYESADNKCRNSDYSQKSEINLSKLEFFFFDYIYTPTVKPNSDGTLPQVDKEFRTDVYMNQTLIFELDGLKEGAKIFKEDNSITFS